MPRPAKGKEKAEPFPELRTQVLELLRSPEGQGSFDAEDLTIKLRQKHGSEFYEDRVAALLERLVAEGVVSSKKIFWIAPDFPPPSDDRHEWDPEGHHAY